MGAVSLAWINTAFLLASSVLLVPFGRLGDLYGRRWIFVAGVVLLAGASAGIAVAGSGSAVILWRVAQGLGTSMLVATALPILVAVVPRDERGAAIGINVAAVYLGLSTGPYLGGLILIAQPAMQTVLSPLAGRLSDRFQPRTVASAGMTMIVFSLLCFGGIFASLARGPSRS